MEQWMNSYAQWDHRSQLLFSGVVTLLLFALVILFGWWLLYAARQLTDFVGALTGRTPVYLEEREHTLTPREKRRAMRAAWRRKRDAQRRNKKEQEKVPCHPAPTNADTPSTPPVPA